ncbi:hypothetical protein FOI68_22335 [Brevibacillus sp. LEMMJ03]|uniref:hypothetical protein n=1 Tax=Brevibacillus sp. LEMMJ03 TaxID=2595056 RepID=UPI00117D0D45|nr:hypothetical protein [Brevibacillus sp. LEMMJ03]TRY22510.1 hypothetical protein FOI68_22335 [Brevibacillus sp. LEMMJ03]
MHCTQPAVVIRRQGAFRPGTGQVYRRTPAIDDTTIKCIAPSGRRGTEGAAFQNGCQRSRLAC